MRWEVRQEFLHFSTSSFPLLSHIFPFHLFFLEWWEVHYVNVSSFLFFEFFSSPFKEWILHVVQGKNHEREFSHFSSFSIPFLFSFSPFSLYLSSLHFLLLISFPSHWNKFLKLLLWLKIWCHLGTKWFLLPFFCKNSSSLSSLPLSYSFNASTLHESWRTESVTYLSHPILRIFLSHTSYNSLSLSFLIV